MEEIFEKVATLSLKYTKDTDKAHLKKNGQFFTVDQELFSALFDDYAWKSNVTSILEPSCGSGTIIAECIKKAVKECRIKGMDIEECLVESSREIFKTYKNVEITKGNFLEAAFDENFDLIVGNPPYFEMRLDDKQRDFFKDIICGRVNIYALFIYKSIQLLKDGGELRFVIPRTILSGKYFCKLREYIHRTCEVMDIVKFSKSNMFCKALQSVIILKLRKGVTGETKHIWERDGEVFFVKNKERLETEGKVFIRELECEVKTGSIVWNKHKDELQNDEEDGTLPLVMASNLKSGMLEFYKDASPRNGKKQFMRKTANNERFIECGPCIFVNRIVGLDPPRLNVVLVRDATQQFFVENHVNVIKGAPTCSGRTHSGTLENLERIYKGLKDSKTMEFIEELIGSTQISQHELECILPIA